MSCGAFEKLIALDAGGDLTPTEAARLRAHLAACAPCRGLAQRLGKSQNGLRALAEEAPDEDALAAWRRGLMARIEEEPERRTLGWGWVWAATAAMALMALVAVPRHAPPPPPPAPLARLTPPAVLPAPQPPVPVVPRRPRRRRAPAPATGPLLVKLETSDPNVVIYWIVEGKGN
jgi:hypothetical protein